MKNMAMNAAAVYGMCCGIFLSFCMKDPFAGRATCSDSSGLTFIYLSLSIILCTPTSIIRTVSRLLFLQISIAACQSAQGPPCLLAKIFLTVSAGERIFAASLFLDWSPILGQKNKQPSGTGLYQREKIKLKIEAL